MQKGRGASHEDGHEKRLRAGYEHERQRIGRALARRMDEGHASGCVTAMQPQGLPNVRPW